MKTKKIAKKKVEAVDPWHKSLDSWQTKQIEECNDTYIAYPHYKTERPAFKFIMRNNPDMRGAPPIDPRIEPSWPYPYHFEVNDYGSLRGFDADGVEVSIRRCLTDKDIQKARVQFWTEYPEIYKLGVQVDIEELGPPFVPRDDLHDALKAKSDAYDKKFSELFGVQTCHMRGPYPWDVEAVLVRMNTGKLVGTQLLWD